MNPSHHSTPPPSRPELPQARERRRNWVGFVWGVPIAALLVVAFLGIRAFAERGIDIVVTFNTAAGARINDTKVIYKGLEAGYVRKIDLNEDGLHVDMTLRMDRRSKPALRTGTKFWLIGANPNITDLASVKAAVAGLAIGVAPSLEGEPARKFVGLDAPPVVEPSTPGTSYALITSELRTARAGSSVFFRGQQVGKVVTVKYEPPGRFRLKVFVFAPYDRLVSPDALFWVSSPLQVSLTDHGVSAAVEHAGSILDGAIELDVPDPSDVGPQRPEGTEYQLYRSRKDAERGPDGPAVPYTIVFKGPAGELRPGAAVRLLGFHVGEVTSVQLDVNPRTGAMATRVVANLYPRRLQVEGPEGNDQPAAWRAVTDAAVNRLLADGFRARLEQSPPFIGARLVSLDAVPGAKAAALGKGTQPRIASVDAVGGGSVDGLMGQASALLAKLDRVPLDAIGANVRQLTARLNTVVGSPEIASGLKHFNQAMAQADALMAEVAPQVTPLIGKLNTAADELTSTIAAARQLLGGPNGGGGSATSDVPQTLEQLNNAARSLRTLADYLGRHPEALLRGRGSAGGDGRDRP